MRLPRLLMTLWVGCHAAFALAGSAASAPIGGVDYYTFAISLTPAFCDQNPKWRDSVQCRDRLPANVHGLWPEAVGKRSPENCAGADLVLSPGLERSLRGTMPDGGLRQHEWKKHGRCSGLAPEAYFTFIDRKFRALKWPPLLQPRGRDNIVERDVVLREFRRLNPGFPERGVVLRCESGKRPPLLSEIRVCLTPDGRPTECSTSFKPNCPVAVKIRAR